MTGAVRYIALLMEDIKILTPSPSKLDTILARIALTTQDNKLISAY